ncbi:TPA: F0F1 ATP synthase subunit alpha [Candidatus Dependentiae bacterium]|nr:MAG: ATP synthase subunit alpha [candidate division TM6 bacterium GW2011_GWE2_31_21]KKP53235.1 MAG: ATP synthase subunit alpha [candidate division TM6 bacterium GW2011_GWF2_33_332]HBS48066.1 F0F1 ATP synthase subunit alpha [Candidatus Dependentiae bacterium]HBZ73331.1 F0F1 ATP synthase subunit alpha [Candidatus Dependentiae bacterium]
MRVKDTDLISLFEKSLSSEPQEKLEEVGRVIKVGDGISRVYGLTNAVYGELIEFESGSSGIVLDLDEDFVSVVLLDNNIPVYEQEVARRTGNVLRIPVGEKLVGRVLGATGLPLDSIGELEYTEKVSIEKTAPGIVARKPVSRPFETGITFIDALIPIGKGQRELLVGNRNTGKTTIALDMVLNQKGKDVICIYVSIGHKQSSTAKMVDLFERNGAMDYTIVIDADAKETAVNLYLAPYVGCTIGEYLMNKGKDVLIIYDSLTNHAIAYRELSLLLRRPPGREAYPGDIFYLHSRLLERSCQLSDELGGGSLTAIPIIQTQGDDLTAYIPTNLISITDGQIVLDTNLFNMGIRPAISTGLSVSRVGGAAQTKAMRKVCGSLKLELAQYDSIAAFAQFGSELDKTSQHILDRGKRSIELLKQPVHDHYSFVDQTIFLFLLKDNFLDDLSFEDVKKFAILFASYVREVYFEVYEQINKTQDLDQISQSALRKYAQEFKITFLKK